MSDLKRHKLISKYFRLRLSEEIRDLLNKIPFKNLVETQVGDHIYLADGELSLGMVAHKVRIRIWHNEENMTLNIKIESTIDASIPYSTNRDRAEAHIHVLELIRKTLN